MAVSPVARCNQPIRSRLWRSPGIAWLRSRWKSRISIQQRGSTSIRISRHIGSDSQPYCETSARETATLAGMTIRSATSRRYGADTTKTSSLERRDNRSGCSTAPRQARTCYLLFIAARNRGLRVCGNVGHWVDLAGHLLSWGELPDRWTVTMSYGDAMVHAHTDGKGHGRGR